MRYDVTVPGFEGRSLAVELSGLFSNAHLLLDEMPAPKGPLAGQFVLRANDGREVIAQLRSKVVLDPIPEVIVDGQAYVAARPLQWYEWVWSGLPLFLAFAGGLLGGLLGGAALALNARLFRAPWPAPVRFAATAGVSAVAALLFFAGAVGLRLVLDNTVGRAQTFAPPGGRFSVVTPVDMTSLAPAPNGADLSGANYSGLHRGSEYFVGYEDLPEDLLSSANPQRILDMSRDAAVQAFGGALESDTIASVGGKPGRAFVIAVQATGSDPVTIHARTYLVDGRLYRLFVSQTGDGELGEAGQTFLSSFALLADE